MNNKKLIEIQYFKGYPNLQVMIERVKDVIKEYGNKILYFETLVEDNHTAEKVKFRGSPTLLIDGHDFEDFEEPKSPKLPCQYYHNGLPTLDEIKSKILIKL